MFKNGRKPHCTREFKLNSSFSRFQRKFQLFLHLYSVFTANFRTFTDFSNENFNFFCQFPAISLTDFGGRKVFSARLYLTSSPSIGHLSYDSWSNFICFGSSFPSFRYSSTELTRFFWNQSRIWNKYQEIFLRKIHKKFEAFLRKLDLLSFWR